MSTAERARRIRSLAAGGTAIVIAIVLSGCAGTTTVQEEWTLGPTLAPAASTASPPVAGVSTPIASASATATGPATPPPPARTPGPDETPKTFSGRMTPQVVLHDGYISMYMDLENTGSEPLTFLNTLYDLEPTKLYEPVVVFPWTTGENAVYTRQGRFFPSPALVEAGDRAVYVMGGMEAKGSGELASPVANIKFCPTRGMNDLPSLPVAVRDVSWSTVDGVTTVRGMLVQPDGPQRVDPPNVGVAFFDADGTFVGAVVDSRVGERLEPGHTQPFAIEGRGVEADRIVNAEAYAFVS
jgi:hypothetical protein